MKKFFGSVFIGGENQEKAGLKYPIKLEYYKKINEDEKEQAKYGIQIIKKEYRKDTTKIENKDIKYITNDEKIANRLLNIFKANKVTPISSEEVITDLFKKRIKWIKNSTGKESMIY